MHFFHDAVFRATRSRPRGIIQFKQGKFHVTMHDVEEAARLLAVPMFIHGYPFIKQLWTVEGCQNMSEMDVGLYWL